MAAALRRFSLPKIVRELEARYGPPRALPARSAFELILWENVAYLATDARREKAFRALKARVGTTPGAIAQAPDEVLLEIASAGILAEQQVRKLRVAAERAQRAPAGDLRQALAGPLRVAKKTLARFPAIGEPGAEKILLLTRSHPVLALDSNGLRVLLRIGFGAEAKSYSASYRSAQKEAMAEAGDDYDLLIRAHHLLRRHGQETCKRSRPRCEVCPVAAGCSYFQRGRR
jgi:endonuclease III